jgi:membrane protein YdbS with pleckstrin-like domain
MTRPDPEADLTGSSPIVSGIPAHQSVRPPRDNEEETVYYEGSPAVRGHIARLLLFGLIGAALIAIPIAWRYVKGYWPLWWIVLLCVVAGILVWLIPTLAVKALRYRISSFRIDFEKGLLGKKIDTLELWHVDDIQFQQSFFERLLGVGTIRILSDDQTTPELDLRGVPNARPLFDTLKGRVIAIKRTRGVIKMDTGH